MQNTDAKPLIAKGEIIVDADGAPAWEFVVDVFPGDPKMHSSQIVKLPERTHPITGTVMPIEVVDWMAKLAQRLS